MLTGANTYTGDTIVTGGTLELGNGGSTKFVIGANGVNNQARAATGAALALNGGFDIDLSGAAKVNGNSWTLVNVTSGTVTIGDSFTVLGTGWAQAANVWTLPDGANVWTFTEATGVLTYSGSAGGNYASWAAANGFDPDHPEAVGNDGLTNLVVYALDLKLDGTNGSPGTLTGKLLSFSKRADAMTNGDVSWAIETSTTLEPGSWTAQVTQPAGDMTPTISYTLPDGVLGGKIFARLVVTQN